MSGNLDRSPHGRRAALVAVGLMMGTVYGTMALPLFLPTSDAPDAPLVGTVVLGAVVGGMIALLAFTRILRARRAAEDSLAELRYWIHGLIRPKRARTPKGVRDHHAVLIWVARRLSFTDHHRDHLELQIADLKRRERRMRERGVKPLQLRLSLWRRAWTEIGSIVFDRVWSIARWLGPAALAAKYLWPLLA